MRRLTGLILLSTVLIWLIFPLSLPADEVSSSTLSLHSPNYPPRTPVIGAELTPAYLASPIPPSLASDIASSLEAPVNKEIIAKAEKLERNPVYIYQYVKDSLELELYYGSMKGAVETMKQGGGNDADLSSLLVALFRAIEVPARYVRGKIELPMEEVMNLIGVEEPELVMHALTRAGIPFEPVYRGGELRAVRKEHIWVEIYIPYLPHRGAILDPHLKKEWIPLDPSIKKGYEYTSPPDILAEMGFDARAANLEYLSSLHLEAPLEFYRSLITDYLASNHPDLSYEDVLRKKTLIPEALGLLPNTLPYKVVSVIGEYASLPEELRHKIRFLARDEAGEVLLDGTLDLPDILGNRLTFIGATDEDRETISIYGGNYNTPGYLADVKPVIRVNGIDRILGVNEVGLGREHELILEFITPAGITRVDKRPIAGNYFAIGLGAPGITWVEERTEEDVDTLGLIMLYDRARDYLNRIVEAERELSSLAGVINIIPTVREVMVYNELNVNYLSDLPVGMEWKGVSVDAALRTSSPIPVRQLALGDREMLRRNYLLLSGFQGSWLENRVLEEGFSAESISAVKAIQVAGDQGLEILNIDSDNIAEQLLKLSAPEEVVNDIKNAINQKLTVKIPASEFTYQAWNGIGYIKENPATGEASYELVGEISGGMTVIYLELWLPRYREMLEEEIIRAPSRLSVEEIRIIGGNWQQGVVGNKFKEALKVQVLDGSGMPVEFAEVEYRVPYGGGKLSGTPSQTLFDVVGYPIGCKDKSPVDGVDSITVCTRAAGNAAVTLTSGTNTYLNPIYVKAAEGETYATQALYNLVAVTAGSEGQLVDKFVAIGMPGEAKKIVKTHGDGLCGRVMSFCGYMNVQLVDEHNNPLSNKEVTFVVVPPPYIPPNFKNALIFHSWREECETFFPLWGDCGATLGPRTVLTSHKGAYMHTILGNKECFAYLFKVSTQIGFTTFSHTTCGVCYPTDEPQPPIFLMYLLYMGDEKGRIVTGAEVGTVMKWPLTVTLCELIEEDLNDDDVGDGTYIYRRVNWSDGGQVIFTPLEGPPRPSVTPPINPGNGEYTTIVTLGMEPGVNSVHIVGKKGNKATGAYYNIFGVKIDGPHITPQPLFVDENGQSQADLEITFEILPSEYFAYESQLDRYKGSTIVSSRPVDKGGTGKFTYVQGASFDIKSSYSLQIVLNRGSAQEVKSEKKDIELVAVPSVIEVFDDNNPCNKAPAEPGPGIPIELENMLIIATNLSNSASINIHIEPTPPLDTGKYILWKLTGDSASPSEGDFSIGSDILIALTPDSTSVYNFQLEVGIDSNSNGVLDSGDDIKYAPTIKTITEINYEANRVYLYSAATIGDYAEFKLSSSFLLTFLGKESEVDDDYKPTISGTTILPEQRFSHNAGAEFDESVSICNATVKEYIYDKDSQASYKVANSDALEERIKKKIEDEASNIKEIYDSDPNLPQPYEYKTELKDIEFGFIGVNDLHYALGGTPLMLDLAVETTKEGEQICVKAVKIMGDIEDLYDFDYFSGEKFAQPAATMQFGWTAKLGSAGNVFQNVIEIGTTIEHMFCLD